MSESAQQLIASALQLAPADRAVVASAILASLESESDSHESLEIREAWSNEICNRILEASNVQRVDRCDNVVDQTVRVIRSCEWIGEPVLLGSSGEIPCQMSWKNRSFGQMKELDKVRRDVGRRIKKFADLDG